MHLSETNCNTTLRDSMHIIVLQKWLTIKTVMMILLRVM